MTATITATIDGIKTTLSTATGLERAMSNAEITEQIPDLPLIMVYMNNIEGASNSQTNRNTFGSSANPSIKQRRWVAHVDLFASTANHIGENIKTASDMADAIIAVLDAEEDAPFFGEECVHSFNYTAEWAAIEYSGVTYRGYRFIITMIVN